MDGPSFSVAAAERPSLSPIALESLGLLGNAVARVFRATGETIVQEGAPGSSAYFIESGHVRVEKAGVVLARLGPGQVFGERALLNDEPRAATVITDEPVVLLEVERAAFVEATRIDPVTRALVANLSTVYIRPDGGTITVHRGTHQGRPVVTTLRTLADGRRIGTTRWVEVDRQVTSLDRITATHSVDHRGPDSHVVLGLHEGRIVTIVAEGAPDVGAFVERLIVGRPLSPVEEARFQWTGSLHRIKGEAASLACACLGVTHAEVDDLIERGCDFAEVRHTTGCGLGCGRCLASIEAATTRVRTSPTPTDGPEVLRFAQVPLPGERLVTRPLLERSLGRIAAEVRPEVGLFGPESVTWRIAREGVLLLGGGRAGLLQLAHPAVATAIVQHSAVTSDAAGRFRRTIEATWAIYFGTLDEALSTSRRVHKQHATIHGRLDADAGRFRAGEGYEANDAEALLWVGATLYDTMVQLHERIVGPLDRSDKDRLIAESVRFYALFGVSPSQVPDDWRQFRAYFDGMLASNRLAVGDHARSLARHIFVPPRPTLAPAFSLLGRITASLMPEPLQAAFDLPRGLLDRAAARGALAAIRTAHPGLPEHARYVPAYLHARRRLSGGHGPDLAGAALEQLILLALGADGPPRTAPRG